MNLKCAHPLDIPFEIVRENICVSELILKVMTQSV